MKKILIMAITLTFLLGSTQYPGEAEAGAADTLLQLAVIGGLVYGGYYFSQNYNVEKKSGLKMEYDNKFTNNFSENNVFSLREKGDVNNEKITIAKINFNF